MKCSSLNMVNFKGYDARPLQALMITDTGVGCGIVRELSEIGNKSDFDVFVLSPEKVTKVSPQEKYDAVKASPPWAQDHFLFTPDGKILLDASKIKFHKPIFDFFGEYILPLCNYLKGGNLFFVKSGNNTEMLVGNDEKKYFAQAESRGINYDYMKEMFGVNKVIFVPQMDFHLDLFIRPLDKKRVLVADDKLMLKVLDKGIEKFKTAQEKETDETLKRIYTAYAERLKEQKDNFEKNMIFNSGKYTDTIEKVLKSNGYEAIRVPGRMYYKTDEGINYSANFMNGIVCINKKGELVYITNKSSADNFYLGISDKIAEKVGFSIEKEFKESLKPYIKPDNIYFVKGLCGEIATGLELSHGGIHCLVTEIPKNK